MNFPRYSAAAAAVLAAVFSTAAVAQKTPKLTPASASSATGAAVKPNALVSGLLPVPDKGAFRILLDGKEVGSEQFEIQASGENRIVRSEAVIRAPGQPETRSSGELRVAPDGSPLGYKWTAAADKKASGSVEFKDGSAKTFLDQDGGKDPYQADFLFGSPHVAVLDNNLYFQYTLVAQLYDWNAKGSQSFPVLIPQDITPGSITVESIGSQKVEGGTFEALRVTTADLEVVAYFDGRHRLMRLEVPAAMVSIVRR
jgi:hypothetical protein